MKRIIAQPSLERDDRLRLCLVCQAWLPIARAALYRLLELTIDDYWGSHLILAASVGVRLHPYRKYPHLARLARSLTITTGTDEPDADDWVVSLRWLRRQEEPSRDGSVTSEDESDYKDEAEETFRAAESMKHSRTSLSALLDYETSAVQAYIKNIRIPELFGSFRLYFEAPIATRAASFRHFSALKTLDIPIFLPFTTAHVPNLRSYTFGVNAND